MVKLAQKLGTPFASTHVIALAGADTGVCKVRVAPGRSAEGGAETQGCVAAAEGGWCFVACVLWCVVKSDLATTKRRVAQLESQICVCGPCLQQVKVA